MRSSGLTTISRKATRKRSCRHITSDGHHLAACRKAPIGPDTTRPNRALGRRARFHCHEACRSNAEVDGSVLYRLTSRNLPVSTSKMKPPTGMSAAFSRSATSERRAFNGRLQLLSSLAEQLPNNRSACAKTLACSSSQPKRPDRMP